MTKFPLPGLLLLVFLAAPARAQDACDNGGPSAADLAKAEDLLRRLNPYPALNGEACGMTPPPRPAPVRKAETKRVPIRVPGAKPGTTVTRDLGYKILRSPSARQPRKTVVFLGGGPGQAWSGVPDVNSVHAEYDVLVVDYPGLGQNAWQGVSSGQFTTEGAAAAVRSAIKDAGLADYTVYAHSYGTAVGTVLASKIAKEGGVPKPKSVVFEGTVGRAYRARGQAGNETGMHETVSGYARESAQVFASLSPAEKTELKKKAAELKAAVGESHAGLISQMFLGLLPSGTQLAADHVRRILQMPTSAVLGCFRASMEKRLGAGGGGEAPRDPYRENYMAQAYCEINQGQAEDDRVAYFDGLFHHPQNAGAACQCSAVERFDSARHRIEGIPLIYVQGENDPNTPLWQTEYHRRHQPDSTLIRIPGGGHGEMMGIGGDCGGFWAAAFAGSGARAKDALTGCRAGANAPAEKDAGVQ